MNHDIYMKKMLACWNGKNIGGILGTPFEGYPDMLDIDFYDPVPQEPVPNDDLELQVMYAVALAKEKRPVVGKLQLAEIWRRHMGMHCDEYAVALKNIDQGILPPWSGKYDNYFTCGMGAAIRSELWACLAPGDPERAAQFAAEDACIDHDGAGVDAEVFLAAVESMAFVENDIGKLLETGLRFLPENSILKEAIEEVIARFGAGEDFRSIREAIQTKYATEMRTGVLPNVPYTVLALLEGRGDFGKTVCTAVNCGMDTDCSGASAGAISGIIDPDSISDRWMAPVGDALAVRASIVKDLEVPATIGEFSELVAALRDAVAPEVDTANGPVVDYEQHKICGEYAFIKNGHWYFVPTENIPWQKFSCNLVCGDLPLPDYFYGEQLLLRFRFTIPEDGEYNIMFNTPSNCQVYLDPKPGQKILHDAKDMLFGRMRLWSELPADRRYAGSSRQMIFYPALCGAPLNQIKRGFPLKAGDHELIIAIEPLPEEKEVYWGLGIGRTSAFMDIFQKASQTKEA
ncbi:MAG: ADP-ribosylglycohydrolase family protein [Lentisphaeria bacterium]|nr:ADP-ribosylglycohydrolase family protein [Lentisphaeria bacterium]